MILFDFAFSFSPNTCGLNESKEDGAWNVRLSSNVFKDLERFSGNYLEIL